MIIKHGVKSKHFKRMFLLLPVSGYSYLQSAQIIITYARMLHNPGQNSLVTPECTTLNRRGITESQPNPTATPPYSIRIFLHFWLA